MSESQSQGLNVYKVVLPTKKVAYLREMKIKDTQLAAKAVGKNAGENQAALAVAMQNELLKLLLIQLDDKKLTHSDKNDLDKILTITEYRKLMQVVQKISGEDESGEELPMEMTTL